MNIIFTDTVGIDARYSPVPAVSQLPNWYKESESVYPPGSERVFVDGITPHTIKKCMPVFDALASGYLLLTHVDIQITIRDGMPWYEWPSKDAITFHPNSQAEKHPKANGNPVPKWMNPWAISTSPGTSCLFIPPVHRGEFPGKILPGVVDTDKYNSAVNFPFVVDSGWTGIIPAGTPIVQVIPFKREAWSMKIGGEKELKNNTTTRDRLLSTFFNSYKRHFWNKKVYR